jgi:hypothetical protein
MGEWEAHTVYIYIYPTLRLRSDGIWSNSVTHDFQENTIIAKWYV